MLCEELSLRVSTLLKGLNQATCEKKNAVYSKNYPCLPMYSRMHSKTAQQNTVKVPAAQFRIGYCPS